MGRAIDLIVPLVSAGEACDVPYSGCGCHSAEGFISSLRSQCICARFRGWVRIHTLSLILVVKACDDNIQGVIRI